MYIKSLLEFQNPLTISAQISERIKARRLEKNLSQEALAIKSGVSYSVLRKFENSGEISFISFIKIVVALGMSEELATLFTSQQFSSMDELLSNKKVKSRKRASRNE